VGLIAWDGARVGLPEWEAARVDTLAVGDGTCHLVRSGRDAALWDCGGSAPGLGVRFIPGAVRALGAWKVRTVVISHPNLDHFFGLLDVIEPLGVRRVVVGEAFASAAAARPSGPEATALASLLRLGVRVDLAGAGDVLALGGARLEFLGPLRGQVFDDANDASLVARLSVATSAGERRFLLTGDIERPGMRALLARGVDVGADVLEAPHHGSAAGGAPEFFIEAARPSVVVQSTGSGRVGDERWDGAKRGRVWWTTAADGAVWTSFGRDGEVRTGAHAAGAGPDRRRAGRGRTQGPVQLEAGRTPVPENDTVGRESPVSNRSSAIAPGAR
ncbi:MAG: MBL fold metallo-hydrolase, partial [Phycisphaerales bacterium]|nr:MBL fold metallo-hydrolase [Phycisphaerales bacterium]